jgi:hypothetical protein
VVIFRNARREDVPAILALLADDVLGAEREAAAADESLGFTASHEGLKLPL